MLLWLVHMCVPTTPLFWPLNECAMISNKENRTSVPEKFERIPNGIQAGQTKPGRSAYILHQFGQGNFPGTEGPWRLAIGAGRPAYPRPAGPTCRPLSESLRVVLVRSHYYPILPAFVQNLPWLNSNKILSELHRKSEIVSWNWNVLSFISYTSTCLP